MDQYDQLFQEIKNGDKVSFEQLFKAFYAPLCLFSKQYLSDYDDCEEVVQGFFLKLWEKREQIEINLSLKNYLFGSVRNSCLNYLKHKRIEHQYQTMMQSGDFQQEDFQNYFMEVDLAEKIDTAINELPQRRREIFLLNREKGLKYREIADVLGLSVKTVETQMGQALKSLREKLSTYRSVLVMLYTIYYRPIRGNRGSVVVNKNEKTKEEI